MKLPRVSVIIPSYNLSKYIGEAIESVLNQTYKNLELIIVDDCSTDNSVEIIQRYAKKDDRIKFFKFGENKGACEAFNYGLRNAEGKYICYLGADDVFLEDKIEKQVEFLENHKEIAAVFGYPIFIDEKGKVIPERKTYFGDLFKQENRERYEWLRYFFLNGNCLSHPSVMMRKTVYEDVGFLDVRFFQLPDFDLWIRVCKKYDIFIIKEYLYKNRLRGKENASSPTKLALLRYNFEFFFILTKEYLTLDKEEILKIFPETKFLENIDKKYSSFLLFYICENFRKGSFVHRFFSYYILFFLLKEDNFLKSVSDLGIKLDVSYLYNLPKIIGFFFYKSVKSKKIIIFLEKILPNFLLRLLKRVYKKFKKQ